MLVRQPKPIAKHIAFTLPNEYQEDEGYITADKDKFPSQDNDNNEYTQTEVEPSDLDSEETDYQIESKPNLNYLPLPSFNSMDVTQTSTKTYEDFLNYQA
eukprot:4594011-Ditylum_brightwellii.AAC.1